MRNSDLKDCDVISIAAVIGLALIVMKAFGWIDISWWAATCVFWAPIALMWIMLSILGLAYMCRIIIFVIKTWKYGEK